MSMYLHHLDRYELQHLLGRGGMAEVWKAYDTRLHRHVAIKLLRPDLQSDPNFIMRFEREAQLIASLHHPNIVYIYDYRAEQLLETGETAAYMVMDYVVGPTLAQFLQNTARSGKFLLPAQLVQLFTPICLAIDYAHQQGMLHRDIKPSNILLDSRNPGKLLLGEPVLTDFGIARLLDTSASTRSGWLLGTPLYMSPEQALGASGNERSDIYALSIILYETCTGETPFRGVSLTAIIMQHINAPHIPPALINPAISPALEEVILRGMERQPEDRYASASALGVALAEALHEPIPEALQHTMETMAALADKTYVAPTPSSGSLQDRPALAPIQPRRSIASASPLVTPVIPVSDELVPFPVVAPPVAPSKAVIPRPLPDSEPLSVLVAKQRPPVPSSRMFRISVALLLIAASMGTLLLLLLPRSVSTLQTGDDLASNQVVGHAFFLSSGQLDPTNSRGINDELQLDLSSIPPPPSGKAYYAWLLGDLLQSEVSMTALGRLSVNHGSVHLLYRGNAQHTNLLATMSRILITQEEANIVPTSYTPNFKAWLYYAKLSQAPSPDDKLNYSMLDHLRHLLAESPELTVRNLHGGLDMWFLRNTQKILEWASAARDDWQRNPDLQHRQFIRILDYLEGNANIQDDEPLAWPVVDVDPHDSQIGLIGPAPDESEPPGYTYSDDEPPGYIYLISSHLAATVLSPDATADQRALAAQIQVAVSQTRGWLEHVHQDAKQLVALNNQQLTQPAALTLLNDLVKQAQQAYIGQVNATNGQQYGGAIWICNNIQRMANFEIKPFTSL